MLFYWSHVPGGSLRWDSMFWSLSSTAWFPQSLFMDPCCWSTSSACVPLVWGPYVFITRVTAITNKHWLMLHKSTDHPIIISLECEGKYINHYSHSVYILKYIVIFLYLLSFHITKFLLTMCMYVQVRNCSKVWGWYDFLMFLKEVCSQWLHMFNTVKTVLLLQFQITVFYFNIFKNIMYSCNGKAEFSASLLQSLVSHDLSEIIRNELYFKVY